MFKIETIPNPGDRLTESIITASTNLLVLKKWLAGRSAAAADWSECCLPSGRGRHWRLADRPQSLRCTLRHLISKRRRRCENRRSTRLQPKSSTGRLNRRRQRESLGLARTCAKHPGARRRYQRHAELIDDAERAAARALSIDARQPNALLAMFELEGSTLDWGPRDQRLRQIISIDPRNITAISELVALLQSAGSIAKSWKWNERAHLARTALAHSTWPPRTQAVDRRTIPQADKVIDQARALWPSHPWLWSVKFLTLALSGRPRAAEAMLATTRRWPGHCRQSRCGGCPCSRSISVHRNGRSRTQRLCQRRQHGAQLGGER